VLTPRDLLAEARRMLDEPSPGTAAIWPRAAALLARQAIEESLERYWALRAPGVQRLNMRAQLGCLGVYLAPAALAREVAFTWHALSRATHHHPYDLDPTREELDSLISAAERLVDAVTPREAVALSR
jgi:hypothetical protein